MKCYTATVNGKRMTVMSRKNLSASQIGHQLRDRFGDQVAGVGVPAEVIKARRSAALKTIDNLNLLGAADE